MPLFAITSVSGSSSGSWYLSDWVLWILTVLIGLIGLALALRGLFGDRARGRPHCWKCRYEMTGTEGLTCPECGHVNKSRTVLFKTRRYYKRFVFGALLFMLALYCHTGPQVQYRRGVLGEKWWESIVPTTVWIVLLPSLEDERVEFLDRRVWPAQIDVGPKGGGTSGGSATTLFGDDSDYDPFDDVRLPIDATDQIPSWQAPLLVRAAMKKLEASRPTAPPPVLQANTGIFGWTFTARFALVRWVIGLRHAMDVSDELMSILQPPFEEESLRADAALALGDQPEAKPVDEIVEALIKALDDPSPSVREAACSGLALLGPRAGKAAPRLALLLRDHANEGTVTTIDRDRMFREESIAAAAMRAIIKINPTEPGPLVPLLNADNERTREWAMAALKRLAKDGADVWVHLVDIVIDEDRYYLNAYLALDSVGVKVRDTPEHDAALRKLFTALRSADKPLQRQTRDIFINWGTEMLPILRWAVRQDDMDIHDECAQFVIFLAKDAAEVATPLVKSMLRDPKRFKYTMAEMVAYIGPAKPELLAVLLDALSADDEAVRDAARSALAAVDLKQTQALPMIDTRLTSKDVKVRMGMVGLLGDWLGPVEEALPVLRRTAEKDEDATVRAAAEAAVRKITDSE